MALAALVLYGPCLWPDSAVGAFVVNWWAGAPLLAACGRGALPRRRLTRALVPLAATGALSVAVFGPSFDFTLIDYSYLIFLPLIWAAVRLGPQGIFGGVFGRCHHGKTFEGTVTSWHQGAENL